jgi:hypothetical protein
MGGRDEGGIRSCKTRRDLGQVDLRMKGACAGIEVDLNHALRGCRNGEALEAGAGRDDVEAVCDLCEMRRALSIDAHHAVLASAAQSEAQVEGRTVEHEIVGSRIRRREQFSRDAGPVGSAGRDDMVLADLQGWKHQNPPSGWSSVVLSPNHDAHPARCPVLAARACGDLIRSCGSICAIRHLAPGWP